MAVPRMREMEFELALTEVLDEIYDLDVRSARDPLERRRNGCAVLRFDYQYSEGSDDAKVVVSIEGVDELSFALDADFANGETAARSAESCEDLALGLLAHLERSGLPGSSSTRRWDDLA